MIKNVIFDLGNVVYNYQPLDDLIKSGYSKEKAVYLLNSIFGNPLWKELDRGQYTVMEGADKFCEMYPDIADDIRKILTFEWLDKLMYIMQSTVEFVYDVKRRGYKIYVLSNFGLDSFDFIQKRDTAFFNEFDGIVVSSHEKLIKPDPRIYKRLLERYTLIPEECFFIDDTPENIEAAKMLGMNGTVFTNIEDCTKEFDTLIEYLSNKGTAT